MMIDTSPRCPSTGATMRRCERAMTLNYRGKTLTFNMPGWYCDTSEESIHSAQDMKVSDRMLNRLKAEAEQLVTSQEIRRIRKKLNLTQVEAGELIVGGTRAFQKYELDDVLPSRAISSALLLLDRDPAALAVLKSRQTVGPGHAFDHGRSEAAT